MSEYDGEKRHLPYPLQNALVFSQTTEDDVDCESPSSFVWPEDSNERVLVPFMLSLNEYNVLSSAIDAGSDIAYGDKALRVMWLWDRSMRCYMSLCDLFIDCVNTNDLLITRIGQRLLSDPEFKGNLLEYMSLELPADVNFIRRMRDELLSDPSFTQSITNTVINNLPPDDIGNVYPPTPVDDTEICNAAAYIVARIRDLIVDIYADLATIDPDDILATLLNQQGWNFENAYNLITAQQADLANQVARLAEFDAAADDLKCRLNRGSLNQAYIVDRIQAMYASTPILRDMLTHAINAAANDGRWALWIAMGSLQTGADCTGCEEVPSVRLEVAPGWAGDMLEFVENLDADTSIYLIHKRSTGDAATGSVRSVGAVPFYILAAEKVAVPGDPVAGNSWDVPNGYGGSIQFAGGSYGLNTLPCYLAGTTIGLYGIDNTTVDEVAEITVSKNPCPVWAVRYGVAGTIISQGATQIVADTALTPFTSTTMLLEMDITTAGVAFQVSSVSVSDTSTNQGYSYIDYLNVNHGGFPPPGTKIRGFVYHDANIRRVTINGQIVTI